MLKYLKNGILNKRYYLGVLGTVAFEWYENIVKCVKRYAQEVQNERAETVWTFRVIELE